MRLVGPTPDSKPTKAVRAVLAAVPEDDLGEVVERIKLPRPTGTPEDEAVRRTLIELVSGKEAGRPGVEVGEGMSRRDSPCSLEGRGRRGYIGSGS